jgi:cellulose synthase/poly-beta-1,6-N-acetylglucosamine synthase-like glycosyltransferase
MSPLLPATLLLVSVALGLYSVIGYPAILKALSLLRRSPRGAKPVRPWPRVSITIPVYNEAAVIAGTLERILEIDYPADRRQILVVSDASTDGTDEIVAGFAGRGVELLRLSERRGKTAAENAARAHLTGEIIINTDASIRIDPAALTHLVAAFSDPSVGVASGRDVSVANVDQRSNPGEQAYVGYEMWVRGLETEVFGIVGASGCLYAIRRALHLRYVPEMTSRDFGAALAARQHGFRAVSVADAVCYVPRSASLSREYRRKVRTVARGLRTLWQYRDLLDPLRYGRFAWMLWSHKVFRWVLPWAGVVGAASVVALLPAAAWPPVAMALGGVMAAAGLVAVAAPAVRRRLAALIYTLLANVAVMEAWLRLLVGSVPAVWEPTRRPGVGTAA